MDVSKLQESPVGTLTPISGYDRRFGEDFEHFAYLPSPLPDSVPLRPATYAAILAASTAVARADEAAAHLPNPALLARPAIRREAVSTSALEGTYAALDEVFEAEFLDDGEVTSSVSEVRNYVRTAEYAVSAVREGRPISRPLLCDLQQMLVKGTRSDTASAGNVRDTQVFIGADGRRVPQARYIPPPPGDLLRDGLEHWASWLEGSSDELPTVARMALGHYQFEALHPFNDGNGRLGRLVAVLQLLKAGDMREPIINLSPWLESRRPEYQEGLLRVSQTGEFDDWICFFGEAVRAQAVDALWRVEALLRIKDSFSARLRAAGAKGTSLRVANELIGYPMLTVTMTRDAYGVSYQAANQAVARLVEVGILRQRSEGRYDRIFTCDEVMRIVEA